MKLTSLLTQFFYSRVRLKRVQHISLQCASKKLYFSFLLNTNS